VDASDLGRIAAFERRFDEAQATDVVDLGWGFALLQSKFPLSEYHNRIVVTSAAAPQDVIAQADEVLGGAGLGHRYVSAVEGLGESLVPALVAAGYEHQVVVTMVHSEPDLEPGNHPVQSVSLDTLRPSIMRNWQAEIPDASDELLRQLADRTELASLGAKLTLLAVYDGGEVAGHAELYTDQVSGIGWFENLVTHEQFRNRGYGDSLIRDGFQRAKQDACGLYFLSADLDDWPRQWYRRLGFVDAGETHHFVRRTPNSLPCPVGSFAGHVDRVSVLSPRSPSSLATSTCDQDSVDIGGSVAEAGVDT
jgi:GNAT superfamily N-acetyltransferase